MDRALPEFNRLIMKRQQLINKHFHREKLRNVVKAVDNSLPSTFIYPINKKNKEMMIEGKFKKPFYF